MASDTYFSSKLNDLLAPYQEEYRKLASPYAIVSQGGWLAQQHPRFASALDNILLAGALTPPSQGPSGPGDTLSRGLQGALGATEFQRKRAMEAFMLPYQMLQPRLQAEAELAGIAEKAAQTSYFGAHAQYLTDEEKRRQEENLRPKWDSSELYGDDGKIYIRGVDPSTNKILFKNAITGEDVDPAHLPTFKNDPNKRLAASGGLLGTLLFGAHPPADPSKGYTPEEYESLLTGPGGYAAVQGAIAAARTGGSQDAPHPQTTADQLIASAKDTITTGLEKPPADDAMSHWQKNITKFNSLEEAQADIDNRNREYANELKNRQAWVDSYITSGAPKRGIGFSQWLKEQQDAGVNIGTYSGAVGSPSKKQERTVNQNWKPNK